MVAQCVRTGERSLCIQTEWLPPGANGQRSAISYRTDAAFARWLRR
jgi:hypothetical protein